MIENIPSWQYHQMMKKEPYPSEIQDRFIVRFPDGMRDKIAEIAKANGRSMNAEIVARLEQSFSEPSQPDLNALIEKTVRATLNNVDFSNTSFKDIFEDIDLKGKKKE